MRLVVGHSYYLEGMTGEMWDNAHPEYGKPKALAGVYLGALRGTRRWHGFEVRHRGRERGVIFMTDADLAKLVVKEL